MVKNKNATFAANGLLLLFTATFAGLMWSRALLSIVQIVWFLAAVFFLVKGRLLFTKDALCIWSVVPVGLFILGAYQQPLAKANYDYLLTLTMYPTAALGTSLLFSYVSKEACFKVVTVIALVSFILPLISFFSNISGTYQLYAQAKTLAVWMSGDHVRYGLFISASFLILISHNLFSPKVRYAILFFVFLMIVFLSIRTAWVAAIIIILISGWEKVKESKFRKVRWLVPVLIILIAFASYEFIDAVKGKVDYTIYDWQSHNATTYSADFSDGARRNINYATWKTVISDGIQNVGWNAIPNTLQEAFKKYLSNQKVEYGWPFNQWLFWWVGAGWWTAILFSCWLLCPIMWGLKNKNLSVVSWTLVIAATCLVESTLSLQYGVFLHAWIMALLWQTRSKVEYDNS